MPMSCPAGTPWRFPSTPVPHVGQNFDLHQLGVRTQLSLIMELPGVPSIWVQIRRT